MVLKCNKKSELKGSFKILPESGGLTMVLIQKRKGIFSLTWGLEDLTLAAVQTYPLDLDHVNSSIGGVSTCAWDTADLLFARGYLRMWETTRGFYSHYQISSIDAQRHHTGLAGTRKAYKQEPLSFKFSTSQKKGQSFDLKSEHFQTHLKMSFFWMTLCNESQCLAYRMSL